MKLSSSKPISSPSRTTTMEKYPPPLMRFLRSNIGNKSRGRSSKSSPMFVRKKLTAANNSNSTTAAAETQEPTSPKVTCIGQVRVGRSSKASSGRSCSRAVRTRKRCKWVVNALFCRNFHCGDGKCDFKSFKPILSKWVLFFRFGCREKSKLDVNCGGLEDEKVENFDRHYFAAERRFSEEQHEKEQEDHHEEDEDDDDEKLISCSTTPPKNALLLTRCRSAPYRSSSLATRFWASPQISTEEDVKESPETEINLKLENNASPLVVDHQASEEISVNENKTELEKTGEEIDEDEDCSSVSVVVSTISRPLLLTRCKSEPASRAAADKIYPEICFSGK